MTKTQLIEAIIRDVCELPDYTSPDDQPELLQCTTSELEAILISRLCEKTAQPQPSSLLQRLREDDADIGHEAADELARLQSELNEAQQLKSAFAHDAAMYGAQLAALRRDVRGKTFVTGAGPTDWEKARDVVAAVVRELGGEARIGATLALDAIAQAMTGTCASESR